MNGEVPGVPITTLAGLASLTDLLPQLPVPGPLSDSSTSLLFEPRVATDASRLLANPTEPLVSQLLSVLHNTASVDTEVIRPKIGVRDSNLPSNVLANVLFERQRDVFANVTPNWANNHSNSNHNDHEVFNSFIGQVNNDQAVGNVPLEQHDRQQEQQYYASHHSVQNNLNANSFSNEGASSPQVVSNNNNAAGSATSNEVVKPSLTSASTHGYVEGGNELSNDVNHVPDSQLRQPVLKLNKLSKEVEQLVEEQANALTMLNDRASEMQGVYQSQSDDDEDEGRTSKHKFFKASEKEKEDERRRKRKHCQESEIEYYDQFVAKRRKMKEAQIKKEDNEDEEDEEKSPLPFIPKKTTRTGQIQVVIPRLEMGDLAEESNTFTRFNKTVEMIFENLEDVNLDNLDSNQDDFEVPPEILIPKYQLADLAAETAKIKAMGVMESVSIDNLVKLLSILELNIRDGSKVIPLAGSSGSDDAYDDKLYLELAMERVTRAAEASMIVLHVLTSRNVSRRVYLEDVIDRVALFLRFQLSNTLYPSYDPVYKEIAKSKTGYVASMKKKRSYGANVKNKGVILLYNKCNELVSMLADLVKMQQLTDTTVLHISTLGVAPFFVECVPELQLSALKLVTNVFSKYEKHRKLLLDDILASIARLPSSKRSLRTYRLNASSHIQMLTALVLQLIQCVVGLPNRLAGEMSGLQDSNSVDEKNEEGVDKDVLINRKYNMAMATAHEFLSVFLRKCGSKNEDIDYRPLFENFVQDLLTTVNTPEWPAAELLLSLLGRVLREKFREKSTEMALRISSLEYYGVVAARLRKDALQSKTKVDYIDSIISSIKEEEKRDKNPDEIFMTKALKRTLKYKEDATEEEERILFLQRVLLDYLAVNGGEDDQVMLNARHFYICQWYRDIIAHGRAPKPRQQPKKVNSKKKSASRRRRLSDSSDEDDDDEEEEDDDDEEDEKPSEATKESELYRWKEAKKEYLLKKVPAFGSSHRVLGRAMVLSTHVDASSAQLIVRYLSSKRPFFNSFNVYLQDILQVLMEQSTQVRTKALKCMALIVQEDPSVLFRKDMRQGVRYSFTDSSTMVREAAVDLVGKFVLHDQHLISQYYTIITDRILDTGVSVRKRVIKILKDICLEYPEDERIPEICVKIIRRVNDEEGIRKLVMDTFQNMWFVPVRPESCHEKHSKDILVTRARNITDVIVACKTGLEWFELLLQTLFKPREDKDDPTTVATEAPVQILLASQQIVDTLVESVLGIEEANINNLSRENDQPRSLGSSSRIVACLTALYIFAKIHPSLLVEHVQTLQPYLQVQCLTKGDYQIISNVARTLELAVPLIRHPSEIFLAQLEEDSVKLILQHDKKVVSACLSCLGSVVNNVTKNFKLIRDCFTQYYGHMTRYRQAHEANPADPRLKVSLPTFRRAMFTVSLLVRHFDFNDPTIYSGLPGGADTVEEVFETTFYFMLHEASDIQSDTLHALGSICIRHQNFMLESKLRQLYLDILKEDFYSVEHKIKVLRNLESYLVAEEARMRKLDEHWKEYAEKENLKEMGDVSSGMASTIIQVYLKPVLDSFINTDVLARHTALKVIQLILAQGLVNPVQIVPYLICMSTDTEQAVSHTADREMQEIAKKYPNFIHTKLLQGLRLSHRLQEIIQESRVVRGMKQRQGEPPSGLNGFLYSIMKSAKSQRRATLTSLLKQFDDSAKTSLSMMLYLADNLAYIPYTVLDEPLFVIHHIDIMISVTGSNLLQTFKESLNPPPSAEARHNLETGKTEYIYDEDLDDDLQSVLSRLPADCRPMQEAITASQGCMLLLVLKEHLKDFYGITAGKIQQYSPTDTSKAFDRQVNRRSNVIFNPRATIAILQQGPPPLCPNEEQKRELVQRYIEFKELMNKIDPDDDEQEEDELASPVKGSNAAARVTGGSETSVKISLKSSSSSNSPLTKCTDSPRKGLEMRNELGASVSYHQPHQKAFLLQQQQERRRSAKH